MAERTTTEVEAAGYADIPRRIFADALCDTCLPGRQPMAPDEGEERKTRLLRTCRLEPRQWAQGAAGGAEREKGGDCRSRGRYPAISVKGFGYILVVRGVGGRAPGDGMVPRLKAIFP